MFSQARSKSHIAHKRLLRGGGGGEGGAGGDTTKFYTGKHRHSRPRSNALPFRNTSFDHKGTALFFSNGAPFHRPSLEHCIP